MATPREHDGWLLHERGPEDAEHTVLLLPGGMCSAAFYDDLLAVPAVREAPARWVAAALPGHGGTPPPVDLGVDTYVRLTATLVDDLGCDVVVGHSMGATVALEMACQGAFTGPLVLLSPSFSRSDESSLLAVLDRAGRVLGPLPFRLMLALTGPAMRSARVTPERRAELVAELRRNDPRFLRGAIRRYFEYLDRHGTLAQQLCDSGVAAWVVFGEHDDVGLTEPEKRTLDGCDNITRLTVADAGHLALNERPERVAEIVLAALGAGTD